MTNGQENIIFLGRDPHLEKGEVSSWEEKESVSGWYRKMNIFKTFLDIAPFEKLWGLLKRHQFGCIKQIADFMLCFCPVNFFSGLCSICPISYLSSQPLPISLGPFGLLPARPLSQGPVRSSWGLVTSEALWGDT